MRQKSIPNQALNGDRTRGPQLSGSNLQRAGDHNQRVTLHAIRVNAPSPNGAGSADGIDARGHRNITSACAGTG